jgi:protein-L-isoaspartate(D-aspartate) O-methyltransferase
MRYQNISIYLILTMVITTIGCAQKDEFAEDDYKSQREAMVKYQLKGRDITDPRVLKVMSSIPRHLFVPPEYRPSAYGDYPLPIGCDQTISQPYIVAYMTQALDLKGEERVLEIGTGSGYQAAVLALLCKEVFTIEIIPELAQEAGERLRKMGYKNIEVKCGDGYLGWPEKAPFDAIIITAAPQKVPPVLLEQLKIGGRLVVPEGVGIQNLYLYTKTEKGIERKNLLPVRFVPMIHGEK